MPHNHEGMNLKNLRYLFCRTRSVIYIRNVAISVITRFSLLFSSKRAYDFNKRYFVRRKAVKVAADDNESFETSKVPLWLKVAYTIFVSVLVPVYWTNYGPSNFLWFSDVALLITLPAIWLESSLLLSIATVGILLPELIWTIDFFVRLVTGISLVGLSYYMFDPGKPLFLRGLSLFHIFLPI